MEWGAGAYLQKIPGEILSFVEPVQVIDEFLARHLLSNILEGVRGIHYPVNVKEQQ